MRVLVTGGAGFIGSYLVESLVKEGYNVNVIDDLSTGTLENIKNIANKINLIRGDIRDPGKVAMAVKNVDIVVHLAARISVEESREKPRLYWDVNINGTKILLDAMLKSNVKRLVFMSSAAVYGDPVYVPIDENHPTNPTNYYGFTKKRGEELIIEYMKKYKFNNIIIRLFNAYGARQRHGEYAGVIKRFIERVIVGKPPIIYGDGLQTRDFIYVKDVVSAILRLLEIEHYEHEIVNLGTGVETRVIDLARMIIRMFGRDESLSPIFEKPRPGDVRRSVADISRIMSLGWTPRYSLEEGLRDMVSELLSRP